MYTTKETMEILGLKAKNAFFMRVRRHGVHPEKHGGRCFFTDEMIDELKNNRKPGRKSISARKKNPKYCWRVSVWNNELMGYVVVKCGMTRKEADKFAAGKNAVKRPCWKRK